jgi:hypothetical protein
MNSHATVVARSSTRAQRFGRDALAAGSVRRHQATVVGGLGYFGHGYDFGVGAGQ